MNRSKQTVVAMAIVGALAGTIGERLLTRVPTLAIVIVAGLIGVFLWLFQRNSRRPPADLVETPTFTIAIAGLTATAAIVGGRLVDDLSRPAKIAVFATILGTAVAIPAWIALRKRQRERTSEPLNP